MTEPYQEEPPPEVVVPPNSPQPEREASPDFLPAFSISALSLDQEQKKCFKHIFLFVSASLFFAGALMETLKQ